MPVDSLARLERVAEVERALGRAELCWKVKKQQLCQWHRPAAPWAGDELWLTCSVQGDALVHCDLEFSGGRR